MNNISMYCIWVLMIFYNDCYEEYYQQGEVRSTAVCLESQRCYNNAAEAGSHNSHFALDTLTDVLIQGLQPSKDPAFVQCRGCVLRGQGKPGPSAVKRDSLAYVRHPTVSVTIPASLSLSSRDKARLQCSLRYDGSLDPCGPSSTASEAVLELRQPLHSECDVIGGVSFGCMVRIFTFR